MKRVLLIQHCQSEHHVNEMTGGWTDTPLTAYGHQQAISLAERLYCEFSGMACRLYSSDLLRARQTAEHIGERFGITPIPAPALRECNGGEATGKTEAWAHQHIDMTNWSLFDWRGFPGAETWREFYHRVADYMDTLAGEQDDDVIPILVTHGGTLALIITWWLHLNIDSLQERTIFQATPGSISELVVNRYGNNQLVRLNDTAHLQALR